MSEWLTTDWQALLMIAVTTVGIYIGVVVSIRMVGLRSLSKMSSFDFAMTVAIGSLVASTVLSKSTPLANGIFALFCILGLQWCVAKLRLRSESFEGWVDNCPMLLMDGETMLRDNMRKTRVTESDLIAKLREANVIQISEVYAVVLETTGDISVLHGKKDLELDDKLLQGVNRGEAG